MMNYLAEITEPKYGKIIWKILRHDFPDLLSLDKRYYDINLRKILVLLFRTHASREYIFISLIDVSMLFNIPEDRRNGYLAIQTELKSMGIDTAVNRITEDKFIQLVCNRIRDKFDNSSTDYTSDIEKSVHVTVDKYSSELLETMMISTRYKMTKIIILVLKEIGMTPKNIREFLNLPYGSNESLIMLHCSL